jgi:hypothetical protein
VLDRLDAKLDRPPDALAVVDMRHHIGAEVAGSLNGGRDLFAGEFDDFQWIRDRPRSPTDSDLDLRRALPECFAHSGQDGGDAVGNDEIAASDQGVEMPARKHRRLGRHTMVGMAGCLRDHRAATVDPWPGRDAPVDREFQSKDIARRIPHRRDALHQIEMRHLRADNRLVAVVHESQVGRRHLHHQVFVHVDQAGHHHAPVGVKDPRALPCDPGADLRDASPVDKNVLPFDQVIGPPVKDTRVPDDQWWGGDGVAPGRGVILMMVA